MLKKIKKRSNYKKIVLQLIFFFFLLTKFQKILFLNDSNYKVILYTYAQIKGLVLCECRNEIFFKAIFLSHEKSFILRIFLSKLKYLIFTLRNIYN